MHVNLQNIPKTATRLLAAAVTAAVFVAGAAVPVSASADYSNYHLPGFCARVTVPVSLGAGKPHDQTLSATYCQPFKWAQGTHQVDVLTAGATYTTSYWNWPVNPALYSYVGKTLDAGRATVAYDRLGTGQSSRPVSTDLTLDAEAYVLHTIVQTLHFGGYGFQKVNSIGHSYGSGVVIQEAGTFKDVSRVVVTGYLHDARNPIVATRNYPANQDPKFASLGLDNGYLTSKPGTRGLSFYSASGDPAVIAYDETQKDVVPLTGFLGYAAQQGSPAATNISGKINVPVLAVTGQQDLIFCSNALVLDCANQAAVQAFETPFYAGAPSFAAYTVANTGHDVALHPSANTSFGAINTWIKNN